MTKKKIMRLAIAFIILVIGFYLLYSSGLIQNYFSSQTANEKIDQQGFTQYYSGDYKKAFDKLLPMAENGNANAQEGLGNLYSRGLGVRQSFKNAYFWYKKSSEQNNSYAFNSLGIMYQYGQYVKQDYEKAVECFSKSIEIDSNAVAKLNLSFNYFSGQGVIKNIQKGIKLLLEASEQGNSEALLALGMIYYYGKYNVKSEHKKAFNLIDKSANCGNPVGQTNLAIFYYQGIGTEIDNNKAYFWAYIASEYGNNSKAKQLINAYDFDLTETQKKKAISEAKDWIITHKEINSELTTSN